MNEISEYLFLVSLFFNYFLTQNLLNAKEISISQWNIKIKELQQPELP